MKVQNLKNQYYEYCDKMITTRSLIVSDKMVIRKFTVSRYSISRPTICNTAFPTSPTLWLGRLVVRLLQLIFIK